MYRNRFLGTTDWNTVTSLLSNYSIPIKLADGIVLNRVKEQDDLILIELGTLLSNHECDEILTNISKEKFENMSDKYDVQKRNNSRLVVMDDQFAQTLWQRLKFSNKITKLVSNRKPLGFNVQGDWEMSGVNKAMRLNKYRHDEHFAPHKDAQYAPSGDERSLLSLIIYLNDNYEKGETKFYFPKAAPKFNMKGLTIEEEIQAYGGLENGYEYVSIKPKKGYAVLFTHNLLHAAMAPQMENSLNLTERIVLRTDVLVQRKEKPLGFAICPEEQEDYVACLNFFREAQQNELKTYENCSEFVKTSEISELYERSLSIRYSYPRLLEQKSRAQIIHQDDKKPLIDKLPSEMWLHIFKYLHEQDVQHLIFAFPQFQLLKIAWDAQMRKNFEKDDHLQKFIPTIHTKYGSRTLFRFSDNDFFYQHIEGCCRVVAVYAFFLLGHRDDSTTYTVRYDRNTQEVCEVKMERILTDAFYNRNCYGSLYRVAQKDESKRQPKIDLDYSVDRTYMINRHQSQFIGQDLLSQFHFKMHISDSSNSERSDSYGSDKLDKSCILHYQRIHALYDREKKLVDENSIIEEDSYAWMNRTNCSRDDIMGYCQNLLRQTEQKSGTSLLRILLAEDHVINRICRCSVGIHSDMNEVENLIVYYNHLIFDFDTHRLAVEQLSDGKSNSTDRDSLLYSCLRTLQRSVPRGNPITYYRVNIEKLAEITKGFNHASCQCSYPEVKIDQFSFLDYTYLSHVHLAVGQNKNYVFVLATYGGVAAL
ncbi:unnamed protein product [Rotaria sordida]|uniref:Fe2OG dioxygenase domain-containing protein n=1 Tax=Rotaria sordida TaxID=392033 RepID=A0A813ZZR2_9BILA|nr:unnamed protein product [Rotaria sordida]